MIIYYFNFLILIKYFYLFKQFTYTMLIHFLVITCPYYIESVNFELLLFISINYYLYFNDS